MKVYFLFIVLLFVSFTSFSTGGNEKDETKTCSLEVLVIDALSEEPIPAACIKLINKQKETYTNLDGLAVFEDVTEGIYDIDVAFISYDNQHITGYNLDAKTSKILVKLQP